MTKPGIGPGGGRLDAKQIYRKYGILLIFAAMFVVSALLNRNFLKPMNLINIVRQISVITLVACAETMLIVSGMIDLSAGALVAFTGCVAAGVMAATRSLPAAIAAGLLLGGLCGWVNGFMVTRFGLQPFIATLAMTNIANGITQVYTGGSAISGIGEMSFLGQGYLGPIPVPVAIMLVFLCLTWVLMRCTKFGLYIYSIGGNEKATAASGVDVNRTKRLIFLLGGVLVGLGGIILMARLNSGQPSVGPGYEFDGITAAVIGGTSFTGGVGSVFGTLVGSLIVGMINNILNLMNVSTQYQLIMKGVLIAGAVTLDVSTKKSRA